MSLLRAILFAIGFLLGVVVFGLFATLLLRWQSYPKRAPKLLLWNRWIIWWAKVTCGVRWRVIGVENIPTEACVLLSNHESQGETYFLQYLLRPVSTVLKEELLAIPFFGLGLKLMEPIAINRGSPKQAMKSLLTRGEDRIKAGRNVLVYPQGSRKPHPIPLNYARGGAAIALASGAKVVPIAHNAASCWPSKGYKLRPGTITVIIGEAIDCHERSAKDVTSEVQAWAQTQVDQLYSQ